MKNFLLDWIYPHSCFVCRYPTEKVLCSICQHGVVYLPVSQRSEIEHIILFEKNSVMKQIVKRLQSEIAVPMMNTIASFTIISLMHFEKRGLFKGEGFLRIHPHNYQVLQKRMEQTFDRKLETIEIYFF